MKYYSTKTYGHERGLSCAFRQPNATHSHCSLLHGYSLSFKFVFGCSGLDDKNWVVDFGGLKDLKDWLEDNFDHKIAVDEKDPLLDNIRALEEVGLGVIRTMDGVGCEKFALHAFNFANDLVDKMSQGRCWCEEVEVREHGANSALVRRDDV